MVHSDENRASMSEAELEEFNELIGALRQVSPMSVTHARITSTARGLLRAASIVFGTTPDAR